MMAYSNSSTQRIFPPIQPDLYTTSENWTPLTPDQRVAQTILALANQEFTRWEWLVGWKLDALGQIGRLLQQHKLAMEAELAAQWQKADFFWTQVQIEVKRLSRRHNVWQALALAMSGDEPGVVVMGKRLKLRQRLVDELLIDTHFAFYNGLAGRREKLSLKDRAFVHIDYIQKLFDLSDPPKNCRRSVLDQAWQQQISLCEEAGKWQQAMNIRNRWLKYFPQCVHYQNDLAKGRLLRILADLKKGILNRKDPYLFLVTSKNIQGFKSRVKIKQNKKKITRNNSKRFFLSAIVVAISEGIISLLFFNYISLGVIEDWMLSRFRKKLLNEINAQKRDEIIFNHKARREYSRNAVNLHREIKKIENIYKKHPYNLTILELLGHLYHLRAISLANGSYLSQALVDVQKALTYNPHLKEAYETRNQLVGMMQQLQIYMKEVAAQLAREFNVRVNLNQKGQHLRAEVFQKIPPINIYTETSTDKIIAQASHILQGYSLCEGINFIKPAEIGSEASQGFAPVNAYIESSTAQATAQSFKIAQAYTVWQTIGLAEPAEGWTERILLLLDALNCILSNPPANQADLANAFYTLVRENPYLVELDTTLIHAFLKRKLFGNEQEQIAPGNSALSADLSVLTPRFNKRKPGREPFLLWLFSCQNIRLKIQAVIASVLVLTAGMVTIQDLSIRSARNLAYEQIQDAELQQDILGVVEGAEKFLDQTPLSGEDERDQQVREIYSSALVRWLARQNNPLDEKAQVHLERYQALKKEN